MSKYRQFKERFGLATRRRPEPQEPTIDTSTDEGKLAHLRSKLPGLHERLKKLPEFDQKAGTLIFHFEKAIEDKNLPGAERNYGQLVDRVKEVELPMVNELETLRSNATTPQEWATKVERCEAFLARYADYGSECAEAEDLLADARKQQIVASVEPRYAKQIKGQGEDGEADLAPDQRRMKILPKMDELMQSEAVIRNGLTEGDVLAIRTYTASNYKYINPATANQKDRADDNMLDLKQAKTKEEKEAMAADIKRFKAKGWLDEKGQLNFENVGKELKSTARKRELTKEELKKLQQDGKTPLEIARLRLWDGDRKLLEQEEAEFAAAVKKYKKQDWMDAQMERGLGERKISTKTDETERKQEQEQFDRAYEAKKKDLYDKGSVHAAKLVAAVKKLPKIKGKVYRGARMNESQFKSTYSKGKVTVLDNLQSSTTEESVASQYAQGYVDKPKPDELIHVIAEIEVFDARDICALSAELSEKELTLLPLTKLVVTNIVEEKEGEKGCAPHAKRWFRVSMKQQL